MWQGGKMDEPRERVKGMLHMCPEGRRLYEEYCRVLDDESIEAFGTVFVNAWQDYNDHFATCEDCRYSG
jgi:hypothetical protein